MMTPALGRFRALMDIDTRSVRRDSMLRWMFVVPIFLAVITRYAVPAIDAELTERLGFDLSPYYTLILSFLVLMVPQFFGLVVGFLLLDQRDDQTLATLQVTPVSARQLVTYRLATPVVLSVPMTILVFALAGVLPFKWPAVIAGALGGALFAPCYALVLATFAHNKVQGFALAKGTGILVMPAIAAWFVPMPWQFLVGVVPTYWPLKAYWVLQAGDAHGWLYVLAAASYFGLLMVWLARRFDRVVRS